MIINFSYFEEFLDELKKDKSIVDRMIVRVTRQWKQDTKMYPLRHVSILAHYSIPVDIGKIDSPRQIVRLEQYCGNFMKDFPEEKEVMRKVDEIQDTLEKAIADLGLELRAGSMEGGE